MRKFLTTTFAALMLALLAAPQTAAAQACLGAPQGARAGAYGNASFPKGAKTFGVSGMTTAGESVYASASYAMTAIDLDGAPKQHTVGSTLAYEVPSLTQSASVCPVVGATYTKWDEYSQIGVPVGVGIGKTLPLGVDGTNTLTPFVTPQFVWVQARYDGATASDTYFGMNAGATFGFNSFIAGASVSKLFEEGADAIFGIHLGVAF
jgi:hypothetical protein